MPSKNNNQNLLQKIFEKLNHPSGPGEMSRRIELCRQALEMISRKDNSEIWGELQNDLACSLLKNPNGPQAENIEQAIHHFEQALKVRTRQDHPLDWAVTQNNLAIAYRDRICGERAENIEKAIQCYQGMLEVRTRQVSPKEWALTQRNLTGIYYKRIRGDRAANLEQSIFHADQALEVYSRKAFPYDWGQVQNTLGEIYRVRIHGDQAENIEQAIQHFQLALEIRTRPSFSEDWAETQNNLGNAYLMRIRGERLENIEQAIRHYQQALEVRTRSVFPENWARSRNNLGNAYANLARIHDEQGKKNEKTKNVEQAIINYKQALEVRTCEIFPEDWAETLSNLAGVERIRASAKDLEEAILHLQQALKVYTAKTFPQNWARTHNNLAIVYTDREEGERAKNIEKAIYHYQQALEVYTSETFPNKCLKTARALANRAFERQQWELARDAYATAFAAQDELMQTSFSPSSEKTELAEAQNLPPRAAYAHVKSGDVRRAVEVMEKGRTQLLRESFELQQQKLKRLYKLGFKNLCNDYIQARNEYQALQGSETSKNSSPADWKQALKRVQDAAAAIREKAGQSHPEYRYFLQSLPFDEIQKQAGKRPLVYLCSTSAGGMALVVSEKNVQAIEMPELEQEALQKQIWRPSNEEIERINVNIKHGRIASEDIQAVRDGYFSMYAFRNILTNISRDLDDKLLEAWQETLDGTTHWLWDMVMGKLIPVLKEHGESAILIPAGQLALLPLHAAWTEDKSKPTHRRYVLDELNISYAPSAHALWQAGKAAKCPIEKLLIVENPDGSLVFSKDELHAALGVFEQTAHLPGKKATMEAVKKEMQKAHVLHFSTHGRAGWEKAEEARLTLANGNYLTLPDIFELDLNQAYLAVLSACETGVPGLELIDEMIGLPAGMMQAGVPGVVGSLWPVNNGSTALLMAGFYRFWRKEGKMPQEALRQAQIWLRDNLFESPYYWAAFTYTGI
jgi:CHAT domain-containing protein/tetratricopeptide (TPR) repeat protein